MELNIIMPAVSSSVNQNQTSTSAPHNDEEGEEEVHLVSPYIEDSTPSPNAAAAQHAHPACTCARGRTMRRQR